MPLRCIIIDDEPISAEILERCIQKDSRLELVRTYTSASEALSGLQTFSTENNAMPMPDLLFLDIEMPEINGVVLLKSLTAPPLTIFTTTRRDYALQGFELNAVDYLVKPFTIERFLQAVNKAVERHATRSARQTLTSTSYIASVQTVSEIDHIWIKTNGRLVKIYFADVLAIEATEDYANIITTSEHHLTNQTLRGLEELLPKQIFCRVHRSFIVALPQVRQIEGNMLTVGSMTVPIGCSYRKGLFTRIGQEKHF